MHLGLVLGIGCYASATYSSDETNGKRETQTKISDSTIATDTGGNAQPVATTHKGTTMTHYNNLP